jgi:hypothetical protein
MYPCTHRYPRKFSPTMSCHTQQVLRCLKCGIRMVFSCKSRDEQTDYLIPDQTIDHRIMFYQDLAGFLEKSIDNLLEPSHGPFSSASGVESRTSANSMVNSTSAPPSCFRAPFSQALHKRELKLEGAEPINLRTFPPTPAMGMPHSEQWGLLGRILYTFPTVPESTRMNIGGGTLNSPVKK